MRPLDVTNGSTGSNGSPLPTYVNGNEATPKGNKLQQVWQAQSQRAKDSWANLDGEGRVAILGIIVLAALSVGTVVLGKSKGPRAWRMSRLAGDGKSGTLRPGCGRPPGHLGSR